MSHEDWPTYEDKMSTRIGLETVIDFGKYKGKTAEYLLNNDINYLLWIKEKGIMKFRPEFNELVKERK
jgi:uncharacterized protein (DUF3820 family)